jgi:hypothetical protein
MDFFHLMQGTEILCRKRRSKFISSFPDDVSNELEARNVKRDTEKVYKHGMKLNT